MWMMAVAWSSVVSSASWTVDSATRGRPTTPKWVPWKISISEKQRVNVPMWAGVALVIAGGGTSCSMQQEEAK